MTCGSCNALIPDGAKFCGICGATQAAPAEPAPAPPSAPASAPAPAYKEQPVYAPAAPVYQQQPAYQAPPVYQGPPVQQPVYQAQPAEPAPPKGSRYAPISALGYLGYFIVFAIPILGIIMAFVWAKDKKGSVNRQNLAKLMTVTLILALAFALIVGIGTAVTVSRIAKDPAIAAAAQEGIFSWIPGLASGGGSGSGGSGVEDPAQAFSQLAQMFGAGWPENEFTKQVPQPKFETSIGLPVDNGFGALTGANVDQLKDYAKDLQRAGFTRDASTTDESMLGFTVYSYEATNSKGYKVEVAYSMGMSAITITRTGIS